tara:strand:+ start:1142 stop:1465 length:324 start_codon:yes stop_codon:yes gene_type:complete
LRYFYRFLAIEVLINYVDNAGHVMTKSSKNAATPQPESFEAASAELEKIVTTMEAGQMPLEASLSAYKRGAELLQYCQNKLQDAQQQVRILEADMLKNFTAPDIDDR